MNKAKKILALLLCAVLLVGATVAGTVAYLTDRDEVVNNFTVGEVHIKLDEAPVGDDGKADEGERRQSNDYHLQPGMVYDKDPMVTVLEDSEECYVRMFVTINNSADLDAIFAKHKLNINDIFNLSADWNYQKNTENLAANDTRTYEFWYKDAVAKNTEDDSPLAPLFTTISMPGVLDNDDMASLTDDPATETVEEPDLKIYIVAQAIQTASFEGGMADAFANAPVITGADLMPTA